MRKTLSFQEQQLFELFSNFNYKLPKDPELILYDFYFLTAFGEEISGRNMNANYAIEAASNDIVDMLHKHMKDAVFYALCAEIRHLFDYYRVSEVQNKISKDDLEFLQEYYKQLMDINNLTSRTAIGLGIGIADEILTISDRDRAILTAADEGARLKSYRAVKVAMKKLNYSKSKFAIWAENMFESDGWSSSYGGKPWAGIAEALYKLERAGKKQQKIIWIDHAYDLQHNTDTVFNKLKLYYKDGGYQWIKQALDWKRDVTDLKAFYKKVSTQLRPMVAYISKATTGKSIISAEDEEEGHAVAAAKANLQVSNDDIANFATYANGLEIRPNRSFEIDDVVKIINEHSWIKANANILLWANKNNIDINTGMIDKSDDYKIMGIGTHPAYGDEEIALIAPNGSTKVFLFYAQGLKKKPLPGQKSEKFSYGDIVTISDIKKVDSFAKDWAKAHKFEISSQTTPDLNHNFKIITSSESSGLYGVVSTTNGFKFVVNQEGLQHKDTLKLGTQMHDPNTAGFKFNIDDKVMIDNDHIYDSYTEWAIEHGFSLDTEQELPAEEYIYKIFTFGPHELHPSYKLYGIVDEAENKYIIDEKGLKLTQKSSDKVNTSNSAYKVGDIVEVTNHLMTYVHKANWAKEKGFNVISGQLAQGGGQYRIMYIDFDASQFIYVIKSLTGNKYFVMSTQGLSLVQSGSDQEDFKFKTTDMVTVVDNGETYTSEAVWGDGLSYSITKKSALENESYYVMQRKWSNNEGIYVIQRIGTSDYFIIGENGIELETSNNNVPDSLVNDLSGSIQAPIEAFTSEDDYTDVSSYSSQWDNVKIRTTDLSFIKHHINDFDWVKEATIKDAHLKLNPDNELIFEFGIWEDGWWKDGIFKEGIWETGHWKNGTFDGGVWESGKWDKGWWKSGVWESGEIKDEYGDYLYSHDAPE